MKKYKVKLLDGHSAKDDQIVDGYLGNNFGSGKVQLYDRGEAIKKARMFGGKIEEAVGIHTVIGNLSMMTIPENALLDGVVKLLKENQALAFEDGNKELNEKIYQGDIFAQILSEKDLFVEKIKGSELNKVLDQLKELEEFVSADYVMITNT